MFAHSESEMSMNAEQAVHRLDPSGLGFQSSTGAVVWRPSTMNGQRGGHGVGAEAERELASVDVGGAACLLSPPQSNRPVVRRGPSRFGIRAPRRRGHWSRRILPARAARAAARSERMFWIALAEVVRVES